VTGPDDWYGERIEDRTQHSVVTETRPYDGGQQRPRVESAPVNDSTSTVRQQPAAVDHVYSASVRPHTYVTCIVALLLLVLVLFSRP